MKRKIVDELIKWKNSSNRMPLVIHCARQVGKTYTALSFGKEHYKNTVYFNLEDRTFKQPYNLVIVGLLLLCWSKKVDVHYKQKRKL